jgi:hypothetical protein
MNYHLFTRTLPLLELLVIMHVQYFKSPSFLPVTFACFLIPNVLDSLEYCENVQYFLIGTYEKDGLEQNRMGAEDIRTMLQGFSPDAVVFGCYGEIFLTIRRIHS